MGHYDRDAVLVEDSGGPKEHVLARVQIPRGKGAIFRDCPGYSKALTARQCLRCSVAACVCCKRDHSIANNVMQQKGSFSVPGKRK